MVLGFRPNYAVCLKVLGDVCHNIGLDVEGSARKTILDGLDSQGDLAEDPHLVTTEVELLTLKIRHLDTQATDEIVVDEVCSWCW